MAKSRISKSPTKFNSYINNTDSFLAANDPSGQPNWKRLGLKNANNTEWNTKRVLWRDTLYPKYSNPDQKTSTVVKDVQQFIKDFSTFASPLLNIIAASPDGTAQDEEIFNLILMKNRKKPTHSTTPIEEQVYGTLTGIGGGSVKCAFRTEHDTKRPSLAEGADSVEIAYSIIAAGQAPPANPDEAEETFISSKASFVLETGAENSGKKLYLFARWFVVKNDALAGPYSQVMSVLIS